MPINEIQNIQLNNAGIPNITIRPVGNNYIGIRPIQHHWVYSPYSALPIEVPVTTLIGTPIVNMPGCVKVNKENKQNVVLCDGGMPYYEPPEYDARELSWQTVYVEPEEAEGIDTEEPLTPPSPDVEPPKTPGDNKKEVECPPKNARRIGDRNQKGDEQVKEYKLTPDGLICETIWEPVPTVEQFVPNAGQVSTTAAIAVIATASAAATPLLLRVKKKLGKKVTKPTRQDIITDEYRKKKGLPPRKPTS